MKECMLNHTSVAIHRMERVLASHRWCGIFNGLLPWSLKEVHVARLSAKMAGRREFLSCQWSFHVSFKD